MDSLISLKDLGIAYRKAKVDLFYTADAPIDELIEYEQDLFKNLSKLLKNIQSLTQNWVEDANFTGDWSVAPKSIVPSLHDTNTVYASPAEKWQALTGADLSSTVKKCSTDERPRAEFRVMAKCSIDFHVFSTLWILKVGHRFDAKLGTCAYGNRLRRKNADGAPNELSLGTFNPYLKPFQNWRDNGFTAIQQALESGKKVVALTSDVQSFYHKLDPEFLRNETFLKHVVEVELSDEEMRIHQLFVSALKAWAVRTPLKRGLPVGLSASALVANLALLDLDRIIEREVVPLYYGRYVDDIILVLENTSDFKTTNDVWKWMSARSKGLIQPLMPKNRDDLLTKEFSEGARFAPEYFTKSDRGSGDSSEMASDVCFGTQKTKLFILSDNPGRTLIDSIIQQIQAGASEWRAMPRLPESAAHVGADLLSATQSNGDLADNLRTTNGLTMRRASFALRLRDMEAYERALPADAWRTQRRAFLQAFREHVIVLPQFFDFSPYLSRVIRLTVSCQDFDELRRILDAVRALVARVDSDCKVVLNAATDNSYYGVIDRWSRQLDTLIRQSISSAFPTKLTPQGDIAWNDHMSSLIPEIYATSPNTIDMWSWDKTEFSNRQKLYFGFDLAHVPFRSLGLPKEMMRNGLQNASAERPSVRNIIQLEHAAEIVNAEVLSGIDALTKWTEHSRHPHGYIFATRPFSLPELYIIAQNSTEDTEQDNICSKELHKVILAVRGFKASSVLRPTASDNVLHVSNTAFKRPVRIAVSSWRTKLQSWAAAVSGHRDPDLLRFNRLNRLIDDILSQPAHVSPDYFILPELALPVCWFIPIARKLQARRISLISGVEYLHTGATSLSNQTWSALRNDGLGFPSLMIYRQDKQRPALHEESELFRLAGKTLSAQRKWKSPPIILHGEFCFSILICSELTNISYRAALTGNVDALFVLEWNKDVDSFNALVESSALDIHAYVIQCNDREYGDSRIRGPYKDSWKRDILRIKGGISDYVVVGEIDIAALRKFQSSHRSSNVGPYKPVPDGFVIAPGRKTLPTAE